MAIIPVFSSKFSEYEIPLVSKLEIPIRKNITRRSMDNNYLSSIYGDRKSNFFLHHTMYENRGNLTEGSCVLSLVCKRTSVSFQIKNGVPIRKQGMALHASRSNRIGEQIEALDSYFVKLHSDKKQTSVMVAENSDTGQNEVLPQPQFTETLGRSYNFEAEKELKSLENYYRKLNGTKSQESFSASDNRLIENSQALQPQEDASDLNLVCVLASINIGVFLFEIATPVKSSDLDLFTLPSLYGAKINQLIIDGEWWRLVTPMFLHSGILHVALGFWALLTFGPQVCKGYGAFTFLLIYLLGGISGNLTSYLHTPESTVGGTGPVFAIIGAWIIYQIQNKGIIQKEVWESMFRKAVTATALSFVLSNFGPIDDWTHLGATFVGIAYGYLTCPTLQLNDPPSKTDEKNGVVLVRQYADPCKSIAVFAIFIGILSSLFLFVEP